MIAIVVSRADEASEHIGEHLLNLVDWTERVDDDRPDADGGGTYHVADGFELRTFDELHLELTDAAAAFSTEPDLLAFASRHSGDTGPLLTAHFTGSLGPAEFGGEDRSLARAAPNALSVLQAAFRRHAPGGYEVAVECTHHGPSRVGCPSLFVELGSDEPQWRDPDGADAVARSILALRGVGADRERTLVGIGGGHYAPRFERVVRETNWAVGHVAADWGLEELGHPEEHRDVIDALFERSGSEVALVDGDRPIVERVIDDLGYRVVGERWVREVDDRPLDRVDELEAALCPVAEGLRFGAAPIDAGCEVTSLPTGLIEAAAAVDPGATRAAALDAAVAVETGENGNRIGSRAALPAGGYDDLVDDLVRVLRAEYESVERDREAGVVRAEEAAFDPGKAATLGVPEGPKFGRLADGEAVEVDGRAIDPEAVTTTRTRRFEL